jgi:N-acetylglucosaminyldiphosphoundecaprenol N-acetyl-beta-D-mannosaminyltransferase
MKAHTCNCLGYNIFSDSLSTIHNYKKVLVNTINQYSYCIAEQDAEFKHALTHSDVLLPDGVGITAAAKFLSGDNIKKISGADLHQYLLEELNEKGGSCFYLGASESTLAKITTRIHKEYPGIKVYSYSPPYKSEFTQEDSDDMIKRVNHINPDALFIGMTAPKQEKWAYQFKDQLETKYICSIGAVFDFYAGTVKRPGQMWINMGLEWLGRFISEPKRLYKRYLYYGPIFAFTLFKEKSLSIKIFNQDLPLID